MVVCRKPEKRDCAPGKLSAAQWALAPAQASQHAANVILFDTHSHIDVDSFAADREAAISRAHAAGVTRQLVPAIEASTWPGLRQICAESAGLYPAYGLHPLLLEVHRPAHLRRLREWIERERPLAIGECGLDFADPALDPERQISLFSAQIELALEFDLPLVIHARRAVDAVIAALKRARGVRGVVHSFAGSPDQARALYKLGMLLGIGGPVTYPRARRLRSIVATMPIEHLVLETDSPDQPLCGRQGERNEPAHLAGVLLAVAELRGDSPGAIARETTANANALLRLAA